MPQFDIVAGLDNATLNNYLAQVYNTINTADPGLLQYQASTTDVTEFGSVTTTVVFEVQGAPTANLTPSAAAQAHVAQLLANPPAELAAVQGLPPETLTNIASAAAAAAFDVTVPVGVMFLEGSTDPGTLTLTVQVQTGTTASGQNYLALQALTGSLSVPGGVQGLVDVANAVLPLLLDYVNENILSPFQIPALQYKSLTVSMPVPVVQDGFLLAVSALGSAQPDAPGQATWPGGTLFVGVDPAVLVAAANTVLPVGPSTGFNWDIISGSASATVQQLGAGAVTVNDDGSLTVQVVCNAEAQLTVETPWPLPNFSFGPSATATVTATATAAVVNGELQVTIDSADPPSFDFSWGDIPGWVEWVVSPVLDGLGDALGGVLVPMAADVLSNFTFNVYALPSFQVSLGGASYDIALAQANTSGCQGPQGELLLVDAQATFTEVASPASPTSPGSIQFAPVIAIQAVNGDYMVVVGNGGLGGGNVAIQTDRTVVGAWEQFTVETIDAQAGTFALQTCNGNYVTAVNGGGMGGPNDATCPVHTDAHDVFTWIELSMEPQPNGTYAIRTMNGHYLTAVNGGGYSDPQNLQPIETNRTVLGPWETFTAVPIPQVQFAPVIGIQTANGRYLGVVENGGLGGGSVAIQTNRTVVGSWEQFTLETVDAQAGTFALMTCDGYYVTAVNGGGMGGNNDATCPIHTDATQIGPWEQLTMQQQPNGTYAICTSAGYYLTAVNGGNYSDAQNTQPIETNRMARGPWETFTAVPYSQAPSQSTQSPSQSNQPPESNQWPFQPGPTNQPPTNQQPTPPPYGGLCPLCVSGYPPVDDAVEAIADPAPETD
jgi:hypothetical protein